MATVALDQQQAGSQTRAFAIAWAFTVVFYFLEYAVRSSPAVMIPELEASFHTTALGISAILGAYYYTYSTMSLVAGAALDRLGAKRTVPVGAAILGIGCLLACPPCRRVTPGDCSRAQVRPSRSLAPSIWPRMDSQRAIWPRQLASRSASEC